MIKVEGPYPWAEHKHQLELREVMQFIYKFRCRTCGAQVHYGKFAIRNVVMGRISYSHTMRY